MNELIVAGFKGQFKADKVLLELLEQEQVHLIDLEDAVVAVRKKDGAIKIKHTNILTMADAAIGAEVGLLLGAILLNPLMGILVGGLIGAAVGETVEMLEHIGVKKDFILDIVATLKPNSSAIFILIRKSPPEKVFEELSKFKARILRTTLSPKKEAELKRILRQHVSTRKSAGSQ